MAEVEETTTETRPERPRRGVDPSVMEILRREAAREAAVRNGEDPGDEEPEVEPAPRAEPEQDMAPEADPAPARVRPSRNGRSRRARDDTAPERPAEENEFSGEAPEEEEIVAAPRRPTRPKRSEHDLPDVDELNSSLRSAHEPERDRDDDVYYDEDTPGPRRLGRNLAILLMLILVAVYALAGQITGALPETEPFLSAYVTFADTLRYAIADLAEKLVALVRDLLGRFL